ncbi:MAG: hypothetical protein IPK83_00180 [Planctomycetes bacterium]|nr:hypothetical protein [Planctomycetota bacterium]
MVQEQTSLDDGTKSKIVEIYNQAIADLGRAEEWNARIAEFQKQRQEAPGTIEEMTKMAAEPIPDPDVKPDPAAKLSDYEKQLAEAETKYKTWAGRLASLDGELKGRDERLKAIADLIAKERKELEEVSNSLANPAITEEPPERAAAKRVEWMARAHSLGRELEGLNLDLERTDFLTAMRDYTAREAKQKEKVVKKWQEIVNERRRAELDAAAQKAKEAEKEAEKSHAVVANLARENSTFVDQRKEVVSKIEDLVQPQEEHRDRPQENCRSTVLHQAKSRICRHEPAVGDRSSALS